MSELLLVTEPAPRVALLTVNRPDKLNALSNAVMETLDAALTRIESDAGCGGFILTGSGEKAFVAGADISEFNAYTPLEAQSRCRRDQVILRRIERLRKPSLAAINGYALGGGLELAMACSMRFASENAKLGLPEAKIGMFPGNGGTQRLPRLVGRGRALEMMLTGEPVDAQEAWRIGLVNRVLPREELLDASIAAMSKMLANAPLSLATILECVDLGQEAGAEAGCQYEAAAFAGICTSEDRREGTQAFLEKRKPVFRGR
jgi:enoyl-CoA hydratase